MFYCPHIATPAPLQTAQVLVIAEPPPEPPVSWPWPAAQRTGRHDDERQIRLSAEDLVRLRRSRRQCVRDFLPDPVQPCQPVPSDRALLTNIFGPWRSPTHDLLMRGWTSPQGVREGRWDICTLDGRVVAVVRYWDGAAVGNADLLDAGGFTVERAFLFDGVTLSRWQLLNPKIEPLPDGPGPLPLGVPCRRRAADGSSWKGLERDGCRIGPWLGYRANGPLQKVGSHGF